MFGRITVLSLAGLLAGFNAAAFATLADSSGGRPDGEAFALEISSIHSLHADGMHDTFAARPVVFGRISGPMPGNGPPSLGVEGLTGADDAVSRYLSPPRQPYGDDIGSDDRLLALGGLGLLLVGAAMLLKIKKAPD